MHHKDPHPKIPFNHRLCIRLTLYLEVIDARKLV
jgi:hypothetical protein